MGLVKVLTDQSIVSTAEGFGQADITSEAMQSAIESWIAEYFNRLPVKGSDPCMRMAYTIVHKLEKGVFAEYKSDILDKEKTAKGAWMDQNLTRLDLQKTAAMQWMLIAGECLLKPVPTKSPTGETFFAPRLIHRNNMIVLGRDPDGRITAIGTAEQTATGSRYYTLLEKRSVDFNGYLTITNKLFESYDRNLIGRRVSLATLEQYAALPEQYTYPRPVGSVGLITLRTPSANCVDGTGDAVSIYEPAMGLIRNINQNEAQLNDEFTLGRHRIIAAAEMLKTNAAGERGLVDNVFAGLKDIHSDMQITAFSPQLRDEPYERREQKYLRAIENQIGMKRGLLSNAQEVEKTAFEVASTAGDYNLSLIDLQRVWFDAVCEYLRLCDVLGQIYGYCDKSYWEIKDQLSITWGNGILYDPDKQWADDCEMVRMGYLRPEIALGRKYDMPTETAEDWKKIREKYMPNANDLEDVERLR